MRKAMSILACFCLACSLSVGARAEWEADYGALMIDAAASGDNAAGERWARLRDEKLDALGLGLARVAYSELLLLARVIHTEAGSYWLPDKWRMAVGEVVLNRVASAEFPNTLEEVVFQPGQYAGAADREWFCSIVPFRSSVEAAWRLLNGERVLKDKSVVFQSTERQGSGTALELRDSLYGSTYFCYSLHPELYA